MNVVSYYIIVVYLRNILMLNQVCLCLIWGLIILIICFYVFSVLLFESAEVLENLKRRQTNFPNGLDKDES